MRPSTWLRQLLARRSTTHHGWASCPCGAQMEIRGPRSSVESLIEGFKSAHRSCDLTHFER